jgi:hypothetical protein
MILVVVQGYVLYGDMAMNRQGKWQFAALVAVALILAGCEGKGNEPTELTEQLQKEMTLMSPTVGGPSEEFASEKKPADITPAVEAALKDAGIRLVRTGSTAQGEWLLGKSLADRDVLVQVLPVYPGRSTVKVTVEGGDALARDLLKRVSGDIMQKVR